MNRKLTHTAALSAALILLAVAARAQSGGNGVYWHIDPSVKTCSMVIDPALTQAQWHTFTRQVGMIASFKSLAPASTLGKMNFRIAIDYGRTPVDQHDPSWINTFTHPDENCPLGDRINYPTIRASMGVTDDMDAGVYGTVAPGANYGAVGGEFKYAFLPEVETYPAVAARASVTFLTGVPDFDLNICSLELLASKKFGFVSPYIGFRQNLVVATETTTKVNLNRESNFFPQGYAGVSFSSWVMNLALEYNVSEVNTFALALGVQF